MKTLSQLIQEAENKFTERFGEYWTKVGTNLYQAFPITNETPILIPQDSIRGFLRQELETIVKESFKNTRVVGKPDYYEEREYNQALSDKHNKENQFLKN